MSLTSVRPPTSQMFQQLREKLANKSDEPYEFGSWVGEEKKVENGFFKLFDKIGKSSGAGHFNGRGISISVGSGVTGATNALTEVETYLDNMESSVSRAKSKNDALYGKSLAIDIGDLVDVVKKALDSARTAFEEDTTQDTTDYETLVSKAKELIDQAAAQADKLWDLQAVVNNDDLRKELSADNSSLIAARNARNSLDSALSGSVNVVA